MLQFLPLSIILVAVLGTQAPDSPLVASPASATESTQASPLALVMTDETSNVVANSANVKTGVLIASSANAPEGVEKVGGVGMWLVIAAAGGTAAVILSTKKANYPFKPSKGKGNTIRIDQASPKLQKQLMRLLHNDQDTASRLLAQVKLHNPNQSMNWAAEKVIYDLERDRH